MSLAQIDTCRTFDGLTSGHTWHPCSRALAKAISSGLMDRIQYTSSASGGPGTPEVASQGRQILLRQKGRLEALAEYRERRPNSRPAYAARLSLAPALP